VRAELATLATPGDEYEIIGAKNVPIWALLSRISLGLQSRATLNGEARAAARSSFERAAQAAAPAVHPYTELMLGTLSREENGTAARHFQAAPDALSLPGPGLTLPSPFRRAELRALALACLGRVHEAQAALTSAPRRHIIHGAMGHTLRHSRVYASAMERS
jgi:hypothetical protein